MFTFALTGRGMIGCGGLPRATLRLPWAMEVIGLSAHLGCQGYALPWAFSPQGSTGLCATMTFQPASFDRDEQSATYSWYAEDPSKIHRPGEPSKKE